MLTFFTTAKPFMGHIGAIQRNALASWIKIAPGAEVILFGDEEGAAETARELGIRHVPEVETALPKSFGAERQTGSKGAKILRSFFSAAQQIAKHDVLCYANCDIMLTRDFLHAVNVVEMIRKGFLMVGRRRNLSQSIPDPITEQRWEAQLTEYALKAGQLAGGEWIDYFVFLRGFYLGNLPDFVIGRVHWDQWLVWKARESGAVVVDASQTVLAVHQNHDYGYHRAGKEGVWADELSERNYRLAGGRWHLCTIDDATHLLGPDGLRRNPRRCQRALQRCVRITKDAVWMTAMDWSRPLRRALRIGKGSQRPGSGRD